MLGACLGASVRSDDVAVVVVEVAVSGGVVAVVIRVLLVVPAVVIAQAIVAMVDAFSVATRSTFSMAA